MCSSARRSSLATGPDFTTSPNSRTAAHSPAPVSCLPVPGRLPRALPPGAPGALAARLVLVRLGYMNLPPPVTARPWM